MSTPQNDAHLAASPKLPSRVLSLVIEWASEHQDELMENWNALRATGQFHRIEPLV